MSIMEVRFHLFLNYIETLFYKSSLLFDIRDF